MFMKKADRYTKEGVRRLEDVPNIGKAVADNLRLIGVNTPEDLRGKKSLTLYDKVCKKTDVRHDPCMLDVFMAAVDYVEGAPATPWWFYTPERKRGKFKK